MEEKTLDHEMVSILFEEMQGYLATQRFTEWEIKFIKDLNTKFFNDPDTELSMRQKEALTKIWEKT